jgi:hypothetical protein
MSMPVRSRSEFDRPYSSEPEDDLTCHDPSEPGVRSAIDAARNPSGESALAPEQSVRKEHSGAAAIRAAEAHADADGFDVGVEAFAVKGRDPNTGIELEVFSAAASTSVVQDEAHVAMARIGRSSDDGRFALRGEVFSAKAYAGTQNADGTTGLNLGIGTTIVGAEGTVAFGEALDATFGIYGGLSLGGSIGVGDRDADGAMEVCGRVEGPLLTLGVCVEKFW